MVKVNRKSKSTLVNGPVNVLVNDDVVVTWQMTSADDVAMTWQMTSPRADVSRGTLARGGVWERVAARGSAWRRVEARGGSWRHVTLTPKLLVARERSDED